MPSFIVGAFAVATVVTCGGAAGAVATIGMMINGGTAVSAGAAIAAGGLIGSASVYGTMALSAAMDSSSLEDFAEQGSWETVAATGIGGIIGSLYGYVSYRLANRQSSCTDSPADGNCFVAGTLVETETGSLPIEEITAGMLVYAHDPETGETTLKPVVQTFVRETNEFVHITVNGEEITTTPTHPFYVPQKGWTDAIELRAGDRLQLLNGEYVIVERVQHELLEAPVTVYNFEVEGFHTYYVGNTSVLVHNLCVVNDNGVKGKMRTCEDSRHILHNCLDWKLNEKVSKYIFTSGRDSIVWLYKIADAEYFIEITCGSRFFPETDFKKIYSSTISERQLENWISELINFKKSYL